ncbi:MULTISPECIES: SSI family serine proteinase inhibitor [Streptomyces]|uniref:SSI family serine proteinase inhibitor n=1 Tax=Streptomyces griseiscabiei TaxID=2993540 RepID=A0ABU4KY80_9ACTN|nr:MULTISPECIES: SSI family serine proteinase inhibitor [Streptomyces]MBZ3904671.1 serine protease [Streptomyces griseiscabiei]MDX2908420.1 SSI family serine proteinase inhibitor [Streptomyces griseiscabiei]
MTTPTRTARAALLAALALLTVGASAPAGTTAVQGDWLYVSLARAGVQAPGAQAADPRTSDTRGTLLLCDPPQGHGHAAQACAELRRTEGDITRIPHRDAICTEIYAPIRATAEGQWNGRTITYEQTFANACVMAARTGSVFALSS